MRKSAWVGLGFLLAGGTVWGGQYLISTVAGGGVPFTPAAAASVGIAPPVGAATDAFGNVYFSSGSVVFKVDPAGLLTRVAGNGKAGYSGDSGLATEAQLNLPEGLAVDSGGIVYIADTGNNVVRKVTTDGVITTIAGNGTAGYSGDGAAATGAQLNSPEGVAADGAGNVYISDTKNSVIRSVTAAGIIATVAGNGTRGFSGDGGPGTSAQLNMPAGIAVDSAGNLYIADSGNSAIRKLVAGAITTVAGTGGVPGYYGDGGPAAKAQLNAPSSVALDPAGNLYIADTTNNFIRKVAVGGIITTFAGSGSSGGFGGDGGPATSALLWSPWGVAADPAGNVFIADYRNHRVRIVGTDGIIATLAGNGAFDTPGGGGPATSSQLALPKTVALDSSGNFYIADTAGNTVRQVTPGGTITTLAGTGLPGYTGDSGPATAAQLNGPQGVVVDSSGNVYISDSSNEVVREITTDGNIATFAGDGTMGYSGNGAAATAGELNLPCGLALDSTLDLYIADFGNNVIREVTSANDYIVFAAGAFNAGYYGDGAAATSALLDSPSSVAIDSSGNIYIADSYNSVIRKVNTSGIISTVAGTGTAGYSGDGGAATSAQLYLPWGVAVDSSGNLFIGDTGNNVIREVSSSGNISTVAGNHTGGYSGDGGPATSAQLNGPAGLVVDSAGNVYIADTNNSVIRLLTPAGTHPVLSVAGTHSGVFQAGQAGAAYSVVVSNATGAGATSGTVTVTGTASSGLTLVSMSGSGWNCAGNTCTRGDALAAGASYPAITVTVNVGAVAQVAIQVTASGGGSLAASATDAAVVSGALSAPALVSPGNGVINVSTAPVLSWAQASGAASYDVYFGQSPAPSKVTNTTGTSYSPGALAPATTYFWQIVAQSSLGSASSAIWSFTTGLSGAALEFVPVTPCRVADTRNTPGPFGGPTLAANSTRSLAIPQSACGIPSTALAYSLNVTVVPSGPLGYLAVWPAGLAQPAVSTLNSWDGSVVANAAIVPAGANGAVNVFVTGQTDVIVDINGYFEAGAGASFYTVPPCRAADTRGATGLFGGPSMSGDQTRDFPLPQSSCDLPSGASAYSLNVTVVPDPTVAFLGFLETWATGQAQPVVSTLNSWSGSVVANAAIVPAGSNGSISVFVTNPTDVILDTNGYFAAPGGPGALSFHPVVPCRVADTRGGPQLEPGAARSFAVPASNCYVPPTAAAYSLNITVVPEETLSYLTVWATGSAQPFVSTLNAPDGGVVANAAIVPAGTGGAISIAVTDPTHVIIDINGYFAP